MLGEISNFIFTSKYARYNENAQRRETWDEAITRLEKMHLKRFKTLDDKDKQEIEEAFNLVREKRIVPSMRSLQFGGKAIEAHEPRIYNCLDKHTSFITSNGVKTFADFKEGDTVSVLGHSGKWRDAVVHSYEKQLLYEITITRAKSSYVIKATKDHKWLLKDGTCVTSLKEGDLLRGATDIFSSWNYDAAPPEERLYWAYGYIYGDGTRVKNKDGIYKYSMVRLCGNQASLACRFEELGFSTSSSLSCKGDIMVFTGTYLKTAPDPNMDSPELIRAFVHGYLTADGERNKSHGDNLYLTIQCSEQDHIDFIRTCFPIAGVYIVSETDLTGQTTNFGVRPYTIKFRITNSIPNIDNYNVPFRVKKIIPLQEDYVWCLEVEEDASFTLPNGLITGNCAVRHIDSLRAFSEIFYLLLCGNGVGIGLSTQFLGRLPNLVNADDKTGSVITYPVCDTIEGWADSVEALLMCYFKNTPYTGRKIVFDYSKIRAKGTPLKTGGGKAPGYKGLKNAHIKIKTLLDHIIEDLNHNRLKSIHAYDILMHCADAVLSGGIRRSATSVIFDKDDTEMINAKTFFTTLKKGKFELNPKTNKHEGYVILEDPAYPGKQKVEVELDDWAYTHLCEKNEIGWNEVYPHRARSNNSVLLLRSNLTKKEFSEIFERTKLFGEPGFVFANDPKTLYNPCFEIGFIPVTDDGVCGVQFCNLTSVNGAKIKNKQDFLDCVRAATIIGTIQATYTNFPYLSPAAKTLTEEEALLGVSITGMMDNPKILLDPDIQRAGAEHAKKINVQWAKKLGIKPAARVTCIKPEGTGSMVLESASGIHAWHARKFFRRVQVNKLDPVYTHFKKTNPHMVEESIWSANKTDDVITFAVEVPEQAMIKSDLTAVKHLEIIKSTQENWVNAGSSEHNKKAVGHNVSCTIIVDKDEWEQVRDYLFNSSTCFSAVSLLARTGDKDYKQAPLEIIASNEDEAKWQAIKEKYTPVNYKLLKETDDATHVQQELVCAGGACELPILSA